MPTAPATCTRPLTYVPGFTPMVSTTLTPEGSSSFHQENRPACLLVHAHGTEPTQADPTAQVVSPTMQAAPLPAQVPHCTSLWARAVVVAISVSTNASEASAYLIGLIPFPSARRRKRG